MINMLMYLMLYFKFWPSSYLYTISYIKYIITLHYQNITNDPLIGKGNLYQPDEFAACWIISSYSIIPRVIPLPSDRCWCAGTNCVALIRNIAINRRGSNSAGNNMNQIKENLVLNFLIGKQSRMNKAMLTYYIWFYIFTEIISKEFLIFYYRRTYLNFEVIWRDNKGETIIEAINLTYIYLNKR
jgi:hypothetical protein